MDGDKQASKFGKVTLKTLSGYLGLTAGTISAVLNHSAGAMRIPQHTRERICEAARKFNYQPNPVARALRAGGTAPSPRHEISMAHGAVVIMGAHQFDRALVAIQNAGLRVHDDFSVLDLSGVPSLALKPVPHYPALQPAREPT